MKKHGFVEGTTGITYVHKKDDRRHRKHCIHYRKDGSCAYMSKCGGSAHCGCYEEQKVEVKQIYPKQGNVEINDAKENINKKVEVTTNVEKFSGVQTIKMSDIVVPDKFLLKKPETKKVVELHEYYKQYKKLDKPIYVSIKDGKYFLEDKYLRYYVAKELGKTWINARIGTYQESQAGDKLNKIGRRVHHKKYGEGTIVDNDGKYVKVSFDIGKDVNFDFETCVKKNILY